MGCELLGKEFEMSVRSMDLGKCGIGETQVAGRTLSQKHQEMTKGPALGGVQPGQQKEPKDSTGSRLHYVGVLVGQWPQRDKFERQSKRVNGRRPSDARSGEGQDTPCGREIEAIPEAREARVLRWW